MSTLTGSQWVDSLKREWLDAVERWDGDPHSPYLASWQQKRLATVRDVASRRSVFYHDRSRRLGPRWFDQFTTKRDLVDAGFDILSGSIDQAEVFYETTGTTGPPTPCPRSAIDVWASNRSLVRAWSAMFAQDPRPAVVAVMGPSELYAFGDVFGAVARELEVTHVKLWPDSPRVGLMKALRILHELRITHVVCAPSLVLELAEAAAATGMQPNDFSITRFLVLGELTTQEFCSNAESFWPGARVSPAMYGSQETMCVASGWPDGTLRLNELNYYFELVEPADDSPVDGQVGELVVTSLVPGLRPLLRFRTGDLVALEVAPGDGYPGRTVTVLGRVDDQVLARDGQSVSAYDVERSALSNVSRCLGYQVMVDGYAASPRATLKLQVPDEAHRDPAAGEKLGALLGMPVTVEFTTQLDARTKTGATASWKSARLIDARTFR